MSRRRVARFSPLLLSALMLLPQAARAQAADDRLATLAARFAAMTAVTGYEQAMIDTLLALLPRATRDRGRNAVRRGAAEGRRRLVVCPIDEPGWVVGSVRSDGWLTLRRSPGRTAARRDQQLEGARVTVWSRSSAVPGVVAVRSIHLTRQRGDLSTGLFTTDSALLDVGAASAEEVGRLGVEVLSVVTLAKRPHRYGADLLAAPFAGRRAACAALAHVASTDPRGEVTVAFTVEQELAGRGLAALARLSGPFDETLIVSAGDETTETGPEGLSLIELGRVTRLSLPVRYAGSPVETVALTDVRLLAERIEAWVGGGR